MNASVNAPPNPRPEPAPEHAVAHRFQGTPTPEPVPDRPTAPTAPAKQARNPLHGVTLEAIVVALAEYFGWEELGRQIPIRCFQVDPSVSSSLKFLRKTPWAREKVESLYLFMLRDQKRHSTQG